MELEGSEKIPDFLPKTQTEDDEFEKSDRAQGEILHKKTTESKKISKVGTSPATEGATQSKLVCESYENVKPDDEILDLPSKEVSGRSSHTNLNNLLNYSPKPQPPLTEKQLKGMQKGKDQTTLMVEQVNKMKRGMQKLQEITQKFNCMEKYKQDIDFLVKNLSKCVVDSDKGQNTSKAKSDT